ncbi:hypothetical protein D9M72_571080 [compost metagenome]
MKRLPLRENAGQFLARHPRPRPHVSDVEMHEGRSGGGVVADPTDLHLHGDLPQPSEFHAWNVEVHGLSQHVLAVLGDPGAARTAAQHVIGGGRAVGGDDVDVVLGPGTLVDFPDEVEKTRVHAGRLVPTPVAEKAIDL